MSVNDQDADYRKHLVEARHKAQGDYDKTIVLLAGGALGLSLTFMSDFLRGQEPRSACALPLGWALLIGSLFAVLTSFCVSRFALLSAIERFDKGDRAAHLGVWTTVTEFFNIVAGLLLIGGVSLVAWFAHSNLGGRTP